MALGSEIKFSKNHKKIFILSGSNIIKKKATKEFLNEKFKDKNLRIFKKIFFLPEINELKKIVNEIKLFKPDLIVAIGGGGVIDYAKIANATVHIKKLDLLFSHKTKFKKFTKLIVVPTTAGSGAEVTPGAVLYKNKIKYNFKDKELIPNKFFFYPELIINTKRELKMSSFFDSLCQSTESLISFKSNKKSQKFSSQSISIILKNYKKFLDKNSLEVTKKMQTAANLSGKAIAITSTGAPHAMSYYLSSRFNMYHGSSVMTYFPIILEFNLNKIKTLNKSKQKKINFRISLLKKIFKVKNNFDIIENIKQIIRYSKFRNNLKKKSINLSNQKKSIKMDRLRNNPIPITYKDILDFNKKVFL